MDAFGRSKPESINWCYQVLSDFLTAELLLAFEELGVFKTIALERSFSAREVSRQLKLDETLLQAACEFLVGGKVLIKGDGGIFSLAMDHSSVGKLMEFFLAYKKMYDSVPDMLSGTKIYGRDIFRDEVYFRRINPAYIAFPVLIARLKELGMKEIVQVGCRNLSLLGLISREISSSTCFGIGADQEAVGAMRATLDNSVSGNQIAVFQGAVERPDKFPAAVRKAQALVGALVFHDFVEQDRLLGILKMYKEAFPRQRLFMIEFDIPGWDELHSEKASPEKYLALVSRLTHSLKKELGPQSKAAWVGLLQGSAWRLVGTHSAPSRLVIYECQ